MSQDIKVTIDIVASTSEEIETELNHHENTEIGLLEAELLRVVKTLKKASAAEVLEKVKSTKDIAYTTVSTTLDRLHKKGLLARDVVVGKGGQRYVYNYKDNQELEREIVTGLVDRLVSAFGQSAVSAIHQRLDELTKEEAEELRRMVDGKRRS